MNSRKKDYIWNSIGTFLQSAISPILLIIITRMNGIDDSGLFSFAMSVSIVFWAVALWGGRTYQVSDVKKEFSDGGYIAVRFLTSLVVMVLAVVFCLVSEYDLTKTTLILTLVTFKIMESLADVLYGILQINNRLYIAGFSLAIKAISGAIVFTVVNMVTHSIIYSSLALVLVNIAVVLCYDLPKVRQIKKFPLVAIQRSGRYIYEALIIMRQTAPVFVVIFLTMFSLNIPRYFLDRYHENEIGYFGIMAMPITLLALFISFIIQPNIVGLSKLLAQKKIKQFNETLKRIIFVTRVIGVVALLATWIAGVCVVNMVFAIDLGRFELELIIMVLGSVAGAITSIYINALIVMRMFKWQFFTLLITTAILGVLSLTIIEKHAMLGSVFLFMIINSIQAIVVGLIYRYGVKKMASNDVQLNSRE